MWLTQCIYYEYPYPLYIYYDSEKDRFYVEDYSTNGTYVNGVRLAQGTLHELLPGQSFSIGDRNTVMKVGVMHV